MPSVRWRDRILLTRQGGILDPRSIAGLAAWYQASDLLNGGGNPANNASVTTWKDKSGHGRDLTQGSGGQPTYKTSGFQSKPAVLFSGTVSTQTNLISGTVNLAQPGYFFLAGSFGSPLTTAQYLMDGTTNRWLCNNENPGVNNIIAFYAGTGPVDVTIPANSLLNPRIVTLVFNGASSLVRFEGIQQGSGNAGTSAWDAISLGGRQGLGGDGLNGPVAEVLVYSGVALSAADVRRVEAYLGTIYNLVTF